MNRTDIWKAFVVLLTVYIAIAHGRTTRSKRMRSLSQLNDFDVLIFSQHWPQTVCYIWKKKSSNHSCSLPTDEEWSIHGIWPTKYHIIGPSNCNSSTPFNILALQPLILELETKWIDVEKGTKPHSFWKHEWNKHGTCAAVLETFNTEFKYFQHGLTFLDTYDMKNVLTTVNIVPGKTYKVQTILDGVEKVLGKRAQVECVVNPKTKDSYLFEIRICFDKSLNLVDCDGISGFPTNCGLNTDIIYPGTVPSEYHVIQI